MIAHGNTVDVRAVRVEYDELVLVVSGRLLTSTEGESLDITTCLDRALGGGAKTMGGSLRLGNGFAKGLSMPRRVTWRRAQVGRALSTD